MDAETVRILITIAGTFLTTLLTIGKFSRDALEKINRRIDELTDSVGLLKENLAVTTALFEQCAKRRENIGC